MLHLALNKRNKMTFKDLFYETMINVYAFRVQLSKALLFPFILSVLLDIISVSMSNIYISVIYSILSLMIKTIFAVTTHRMILLGPDSVPEWGTAKWSSRETAFILYLLALAFMIFIISIIIQVPVFGVLIFFVLIFLYLVLLIPRLSLVFPAIAVGDSCSFKTSWAVTRNYQKEMIFATILIPLTASIPIIILLYLPYTFLLVSVLKNVTTVIGVAALSLSYKYILDEVLKGS